MREQPKPSLIWIAERCRIHPFYGSPSAEGAAERHVQEWGASMYADRSILGMDTGGPAANGTHRRFGLGVLLFSANVGHDVGWGAASRRIACCGMSEDSGLCPGATCLLAVTRTCLASVGVCADMAIRRDMRVSRAKDAACCSWLFNNFVTRGPCLVKFVKAPRRAARRRP